MGFQRFALRWTSGPGHPECEQRSVEGPVKDLRRVSVHRESRPVQLGQDSLVESRSDRFDTIVDRFSGPRSRLRTPTRRVLIDRRVDLWRQLRLPASESKADLLPSEFRSSVEVTKELLRRVALSLLGNFLAPPQE